jgi:thiamine pyrophosphokinase
MSSSDLDSVDENVDEKLFSALAKIEQIFTSKQKQTDIASFLKKI